MEPGKAVESTSQVGVVKTPKVVFSGIQMAFGRESPDMRLAFERLNKALSSLILPGGVVAARFYSTDRALNLTLPLLGRELFHRDGLASSTFEVEGLPSLDASAGMDIIAEAN